MKRIALTMACIMVVLSGVECSLPNGPTPIPPSSPTPWSEHTPTPLPSPTPTWSPSPTPTSLPSPTPTLIPGTPGLLFTRVNEKGFHLYVLPSPEAEAKQLTFGDSLNYSGRWSPDYERIAFLALYDQVEQIDLCVMSANGEDFRVLDTLDLEQEPRGLQWSPDGRWLVFWGWDAEGDTEVWLVDVAAAELRNITGNQVIWDAYPCWHPDSEHLFIVSDRTPDGAGKFLDQIYLIDLDGNVQAHVSSELEPEAENTRPGLSPDGQTLAWIAWSLFSDGGIGLTGSNLLLAEPDGSNVRLVADADDVVEFTWSPDSTHIAFIAAETAPFGTVGRIRVLNVESGEHWEVSDPEAPPLAGQIAWSPDSQRLCYIQKRDEEALLGTLICVDIDGTNRFAISSEPFDGLPDWGH